MVNRLVIVGAGGHGKVVADIALLLGYRDVVFCDDDESAVECAGLPVVGRVADAVRAYDADIVVAIGNPDVRRRICREIDEVAPGRLVTLVHPRATVGRRVRIGEGCVVMAGAVVNSDTVIGRGVIVNTGATIDHDGRIGDFAHVSVGSHLAGAVEIGAGTWMGIGSIVSTGARICPGCMVGAGAVVVKDIDAPGTYVGVPARLMGASPFATDEWAAVADA